MRSPGLLAFVLIVPLLAAAAAAQAPVEPPVEQPLAILQVAVVPAEAHLAGDGTTELSVSVTGSLACTAGLTRLQPPDPIRGVVVADRSIVERLQLTFEPALFEVPWTPAGASAFQVDENVTIAVHVGAAPATREVTRFSVIIEPRTAEETRPRCSPQGYTVEGQERSVQLIVQPTEEETPFIAPVGGRINWAPLLMAFVLLGIVGVFAVRRERERGGGD